MLKKFFNAVLMTFLIFGASSLSAEYPPLTPAQEASFEAQMNAIIARAEQHVKDTQYNATRTDIAPTWSSKLELQNAIIQLEVKKTLFNNFKNTASLRSPLVQQKLLATLRLPSITTADLADLQNTVLTEKANIQAYDSQQQVNSQTPTTTTTPTFPTTTVPTTTTPAPSSNQPLPSNVIIPQ